MQDDSNGQGAYIKEWNLDIAQPTDEQLASYETAANTAESNAQVDATRKAAYGDIGDQLDEIYHDIDAWKTRIQGIKTDNPKELIMAYIGKSPVIGNFVKLDAITAVNGQAAYTMQNGGSNFTDYESVNQFLVSLNGTIQAPTDSFTVSGSTLTFASNLSTGDVIDFIMVFGNSLSAGTPTDATVSTAKIVDDAVTAAKINNDIISGSTEHLLVNQQTQTNF